MFAWVRIFALAGLAFAMLAAGCAAPSAAPAPTSAPAATQPPAKPAATAAPAAKPTQAAQPAAAKQPVTLTFWHGMGGDQPGTQGGTLAALAKQYTQLNPNVTINLDYTEYTGGALRQKIMASIAAANPPDLAQAFENEVAAYYKAGAIVPLDEYVKGPNGVSADDLKDIPQALLDTGRFAQFDNRLLSFPFNKSLSVLWYNVPLLRAAGFEKPPATWDEFRQLCDKVAKEGVTCWAIQPNATTFTTFLWTRGGVLADADFKEARFNSPEGVAVLELEQELVKKGQAYVSRGFDWQNDFGAQKVAMVFSSMVSDPFIDRVVKGTFDYSMAPYPTAPGKPTATVLTGTNAVIFKSTPEKQAAAWDFVKWATSREQTAFWASETGYLPVRTSALETPTLQQVLQTRPRYKVALDLMPYGRPEPSLAPWTQVRDFLQDAENKVLSQTASAQQALDEAARKANEVLRQGG